MTRLDRKREEVSANTHNSQCSRFGKVLLNFGRLGFPPDVHLLICGGIDLYSDTLLPRSWLEQVCELRNTFNALKLWNY